MHSLPAAPAIDRHPSDVRLMEVILKTSVTHTVTYFVAGIVAMLVFNYEESFNEVARTSGLLRPFDDPLIMAGPLLQTIRGTLFGLAFYPLRSVIFARPYGWLILWWTLMVIGIWSAFGPAPHSIEGLIYTNLSGDFGNLETEIQALGLSGILWVWIQYPKKRWLTWVMWASFTLILILITLGLLQKFGVLPA